MKNRWERLADFTALCTWIITGITMAVLAYSSYGVDFRGYYAAARVLLNGGNPYDYSLVASVLLDGTGRVGNNPFYYPLWFGWFITLLAWMPFEVARSFDDLQLGNMDFGFGSITAIIKPATYRLAQLAR
jgi:hypothetical protein